MEGSTLFVLPAPCGQARGHWRLVPGRLLVSCTAACTSAGWSPGPQSIGVCRYLATCSGRTGAARLVQA